MMDELFFTGDTHFGHKAMAEKWRNLGGVEEMDELLVDRWNATVSRGDNVYHLGDFSFYPRTKATELLGRLNGNIHLIVGNHDKIGRIPTEGWTSVRDYRNLKWSQPGERRSQRIVLFHFPIIDWEGVHHGAWHLHGHTHGNLTDDPRMARCDVGVDVWDYRPVHVDRVVAFMVGRRGTPDTHHQADAE